MPEEPGKLTVLAPRRAKPARHLADLTVEERRAAVAAAGLEPYRADQLSRHYFGRLSVQATKWTEILP